MTKWLYSFMAATMVFFTAQGISQETIVDSSTGISFPKEISFTFDGKDYHLQATGVATRKKFFVKVYSIAHYLDDSAKANASNILDLIFDGKYAKQLTMKWARNVGSDKIREGYTDTFNKVFADNERQNLQSQIDTFLSFFKEDAAKGDITILRWIPDGIIQVEINGSIKGEVKSEPFAEAVWGIWLGKKSVVKRKDLISEVK